MNGIIIVHKEKGFTSNDVVVILKKLLKTKKVGHAGTLDPNATGVLVIAVGIGTKLLEYIVNEKKIYYVDLILGFKSDTYDITGNLIPIKFNINNLNNAKIKMALNHFSNKIILQKPPIYSSIKIKGKKLYEYARLGEKINIKKRKVQIYEIIKESNISFIKNKYHVFFSTKVSKGTYIRSLCVDIGKAIDIPCIMGDLKRISVGDFKLSESNKISEIKNKIINKDYSFCLSLNNFLKKKMSLYDIKIEDLKKLYEGKVLNNEINLSEGTIFAYKFKNEIVSICKIENNKIKTVKNLQGAFHEVL